MDFTALCKWFLKRKETGDRRKAPRFDASAVPGFKNIIQVGGPELKLINISRCGALIESREPISSDESIALQIVIAEEAYIIKGRVVHHHLYSKNDDVIRYQSAIAFDEDFTVLPSSIDKDFGIPPGDSDAA
jgi:hypothetical protein